MPGAIHNYWLAIMALSFALAMTLWIGLVFYANRHPGGKAQESWPHRDVMGGSFEARQGGRQVMPDPTSPPEPQPEPGPEPEATVPAAPKPTPPMPAPRESPESEPAKADR
jgi:hypothetical protein